jgi:hypothetical protein
VLLYLHGGGFTVGSLDTHDSLCRQLSAAQRRAVVALDYRLAPEHRFPTAAGRRLGQPALAGAGRGPMPWAWMRGDWPSAATARAARSQR